MFSTFLSRCRPGFFALGILAGWVGSAGPAFADQAPPTQETGPMNRDAAVRMARAFMQSLGQKSPGLNDKNLGGADFDGHTLYFEYLPSQKALRCNALVYRFQKPPRPGVVDGFKKEQQDGTDTGGGSVEYQTDSHGLYLVRTYTAAVPDASFILDMQRLVKASQAWNRQVLPRVAARVFHSASP